MFKPPIAIYSETFLTISMTFIYRQLLGISNFYEPIVLTSKKENIDIFPFDPIYEHVAPLGVRNRIFRKLYCNLSPNYTFATRAQLMKWRDACYNHKVRLIHAHFGTAGLQMLPLAQWLGVPLLVTFHGFDASSLLRKRNYMESIRHMFDYTHNICVSKIMKDTLEKYGANPRKTWVHYIGVPLKNFTIPRRKSIRVKHKMKETIRFLQVSNFVEKKGHEYTVEAFQRFLTFYSNAHLIFAGSGPLYQNIIDKSKKMGLSNKVTFVGRVVRDEAVKLMHKSDVFLHHSVTAKNGDQEGIPTVIMEAMATGMPVVSTYHAGIPELITDGVEGLLAKEKDVKTYTQKMIDILEIGDELAKNGRKKIEEQFDMDKQNIRLIEIYESILKV
jgi:colanic acid/amylovoran biosynthesis glycosyltransferase